MPSVHDRGVGLLPHLTCIVPALPVVFPSHGLFATLSQTGQSQFTALTPRGGGRSTPASYVPMPM